MPLSCVINNIQAVIDESKEQKSSKRLKQPPIEIMSVAGKNSGRPNTGLPH